MARITEEEIISKLNIVNPTIKMVGKYQAMDIAVDCKCTVCGREWATRPRRLLNGIRCTNCHPRKLKSTKQFVDELAKVNDKIEILGEYVSAQDKIHCKCKICGDEWNATPDNLLHGTGCPLCANNKRWTTNEFIERMSKINDDVIIVGDYITAHTPIRCECKICGTLWNGRPSDLLHKEGCPACGRIKRILSYKRTQKEFEDELAQINPNIEIIGEYITCHEKVACSCKKCSHVWSAVASSLLRGTGCPNCARLARMDLTLSEEERVANRQYPEYNEFISNVFKRDNGVCQLTFNSGNVVVHHLDGYNWCVEGRTDVNNAITISDDMHKEFHSRYGYGNNTKRQFVEFVNDLYKENKITRSAYEWVMGERLK